MADATVVDEYGEPLLGVNPNEPPGALDPIAALEAVTVTAYRPLIFASDVPHRAMFNFYEWNGISQRLVGNQETNPRTSYRTVSLPMPGDLQTTYAVNYDSEPLGGVTAGLASLAGGGNAGMAAGQVGSGLVADLLNQFATGRVITAGAGLARNPHQVLLLQGVDFREFQFNYRFSPQSKQEALDLLKIINSFKTAMSVGVANAGNLGKALDIVGTGVTNAGDAIANIDAGLATVVTRLIGDGISAAGGGIRSVRDKVSGNFAEGAAKNFFTYPDYFEIDFHHNDNPSKYLFKIGPSVLTSFNVQYHPNSIPSYATEFSAINDETPTPTEVQLTMSFKELEIITRDRIEGGR